MKEISFKRIWKTLGVISMILFFSISSASAQEKLLMGFSAPVTGPTAETGFELMGGAKTAEAMINSTGGINGTMVELLIIDDQLDKVQAVNNFRKFAGMKNLFVIGTTSTGTSMACQPLAERFKTPQVTGSSIGHWPKGLGEWTFRTTIPDPVTVPYLLKAMKEKLGIGTIGMMYDYKDDWSVLCLPIFKKAVETVGIKTPIEPQSFGRGDSDFSAQLTKLKAAKVDAIFMPAQVREGSLILIQARGLGIKSAFCGTSGYISVSGLKAAGEAADGVLGVTTFHPDSKKPGWVRFHKKFKELFPDRKVGTYDNPTWYDAYMLAAEAARRANIKAPVTEKDKIRIRDEWAKIKGWEGATGIFTFQGPGDPLPRDGVLVRWSSKENDFKLAE